MLDASSIILIGVAIAAGAGAIGSTLGTAAVAKTGAGLLSKEPQKFPLVLVLSALPASQALYGLLFSIVLLLQTGLINGKLLDGINTELATQFMLSALPASIANIISGWQQGEVASSAMRIVAEKPQNLNQAIVITALIESFAIFGLIISILIVFVGIKIT